MESKLLKNILSKNSDPLIRARIFIIAFIAISLLFLAIFLYKDFYQTIIYAREVTVLKQEVSIENIDIEKFNKVLKTHNYKITPIIGQIISDPFKTGEIKQEEDDSTQDSIQ